MNKLTQFLALTGCVLIITSYQYAAGQTDTIPKKSDSIRTDDIDTTGKPDTVSMARKNTGSPKYVDLSTSQPVDLYYDAKARKTYSSVTNEPVEFYVDMNTGDTVYGRGRYIVNNYIVRSTEGMYRLDAGKIKIDKDDIKIKEGNKKFKMDNSNMKMKGYEGKMKADSTGSKVKTNGMKKKSS